MKVGHRYLIAVSGFVWLGLTVAFSSGCQASSSREASITIRFPQSVSDSHPRVMAVRKFAEQLMSQTQGRIQVEMFTGGQLYGARQAVLATTLGDVEMAMEPETHFITFDEAFKAIDVPFVFDTAERFRAFLNGRLRTRVEPSLARSGVQLVALWDEGPMILASRERLLRRPEDFSGVKIRSSGHDLLARSWNEMGAATVRIPIHEVYSALQQGVADAIYTTLNAFVTGKIYEVAPKTVLWPSRASYVWVANRAFWESLAEPDRRIVRRLVDEATSEYDRILESSYAEMVATVEGARQGEWYELTPEELQAFRSRQHALVTGWLTEYEEVLGPLGETSLAETP